MTDSIKNKVFFFAFGLIWLAIILWNLATPTQTFSQAENRTLASFPEFNIPDLLDGDFMNGVDTFFNDQFAGRPYWVSGQTLIEYGIGKREINSIFMGRKALLGNLAAEDEAMSNENIAGVNAFAEKYSIPTYVMLVPSSTSVQPEKLPFLAEGWDEKSYIESAYGKFSNKVTSVPVFDTLTRHRDEYIFYRTDHHWTTYGAYLALGEMYGRMGKAIPKESDFDISTVSDSFKGTFHSKTGFPLVKDDEIQLYQRGKATAYDVFDGKTSQTYDSVFFKEFLGQKDKYSFFLGLVQPMATIQTNSASGKKLLVFKDSYAHSLLPMMFEDYSEIRIVDLRYLNAKDYAETLEISKYDEAVFLYSADVFAHQKGPYKLQ